MSLLLDRCRMVQSAQDAEGSENASAGVVFVRRGNTDLQGETGRTAAADTRQCQQACGGEPRFDLS
jgi:hypothetical protein